MIAYPSSREAESVSAIDVATQMRISFKLIRLTLLVGIGEGVSGIREDVLLGDIVVSKPIAGRPSLMRY